MLLDVKNIKKYFPVKKGFLSASSAVVKAVDDVSLSITPQENVSLVGESGCGKTTLARMILKIIQPTAGQIVFDGQNMTTAKKDVLRSYRKNVQIVFQDPYSSLDPRFTIRSVLKEAMHLDQAKYKTRTIQEQRMIQLLRAVNLKEDMLSRYPHEFSGGERQRIAIARALVLNPRLLVLDEAVSSLDVIIQEQILNLLKDLQKQFKLTYLFISHNLKVVKKVSQKIAVMYKGRIVEMGPTAAIFQNPLHPYTQELLTAALQYKTVPREKELTISENSSLIDQGGGHFLLVS